VKAAVDEFAAKANKVGRSGSSLRRARKSPTPGMAAFVVMVEAV
jgi:hypothetical protein